MKIINCEIRHASTILAIFNDAILNTTGLYDYKPRTPEMMESWFETKRKGNFPILGVESDDGTLLGFASYGTFRAWPAYKYSVEHSVYVDAPHRGKGIGKLLVGALIDVAKSQDYHTIIGGIDATNTVSVRLHERLGFEKCASIKQAAFKFGRWLDLEFHQLILATPKHPSDG